MHWVFVAALRLYLVAKRAGATLHYGGQASHWGGFSGWGAQALGLEAFSIGSSWASLPCGMWDLPRPGVKPVSHALAGRFFLTTGSPGKSCHVILNKSHLDPKKEKEPLGKLRLQEASHWPMRIELTLLESRIQIKLACFHSNPKERQCQRVFKLAHNCTHLTRY